jgi:hypothetical protein
MSSKEDLLYALSVKKLRELAKENRVLLITKSIFWGDSPATLKEDIIEILLKSRKVSKKKVENKIFGTSKKKTPTKSKPAKGRKPRRKSLAKAQKTLILKSQNFKCAMCKTDISKISPHFDHRIPLAMRGSNTITNIQALCGTCHTEKTKFDRLEISRARGR